MLGVLASDGDCLAYERLSATLTSAVGFTAAKLEYKGNKCRAALITVETATIRFTMDGTTPTVTASGGIGTAIAPGQSFVVRGFKSVSQFKAINEVASNGAVMHCHYFFSA